MLSVERERGELREQEGDRALSSAAALIAAVIGCPASWAQDQEPLRVYVSIAPQKFFVQRLAGDGANVTVLPVPSSTHTVVVNVWSPPTSFVASGAIVIFASTNVFVAGPLLAAVP